MPRPADPANAPAQARTQRWRSRNRERGRPEASAVDTAIAEAVAAAVSAAALDGTLDPAGILGMLVRDAVRTLVAVGYDREEARAKARQRLGRFGYHVPPVADDS